MSEDIIIYTDGACLGNPGKGGFGAVIMKGDEQLRLAAGFRLTTNNRMEIMAVIAALKAVAAASPKKKIRLHTDSRLIVDAMNAGWLNNWRRNGWRKSDKTPVLNQDLWNLLLTENNKHSVTYVWVKGHSGIPENELCDRLSKEAASGDKLKIDHVYEGENGMKTDSLFPGSGPDFPAPATEKHTIFESGSDSIFGRITMEIRQESPDKEAFAVFKQNKAQLSLTLSEFESLYNKIKMMK